MHHPGLFHVHVFLINAFLRCNDIIKILDSGDGVYLVIGRFRWIAAGELQTEWFNRCLGADLVPKAVSSEAKAFRILCPLCQIQSQSEQHDVCSMMQHTLHDMA